MARVKGAMMTRKRRNKILKMANGLKKAGVTLNRKMLSEIAIADPAGFTALVEKAKAAL